MVNSLAFKLHNILSSGNFLSSFFAADGDIVDAFDMSLMTKSIFNLVMDFLVYWATKVIYTICSFVMSMIDIMHYMISAILGIDVGIEDYALVDYNNPLIRIISSEPFTKAFRALMGVAIVLLIVFTIFAIVKSEYNFAAKKEKSISKTRIFGRSLRSLFIMWIFPIMFLFVFILTNAIMAGFNDILKLDNRRTTMGGQIFVTSAYQANMYRRYADNDLRIPIKINFDDPITLGTDYNYTNEQLRQIYAGFEDKGKQLIKDFDNLNFSGFSDTVVYRNNRVMNQASYSGYENFFCTKEQYYVMADFMDYAVKTGLNYTIKNMKDADIDWGYVDNTVYDPATGALTITYRDVSNMNNGEPYTVVYAPETEEVSSPISDAIKTISALLGIGEYSDNVFNVLNRLENSINIVEWGTELAKLKFSDSVDLSDINIEDFTEIDKILFYEHYKYKYNNDLHYTLEELCEGVQLPVYKLEKRQYQASTASYVTYEEHYVVKINNTLYVVEENKNDQYTQNGYVDYYFNLVSPTTTTTLTAQTDTENEYTSYKKDNIDAWKEITVQKTNGTIETIHPAEEIINDTSANNSGPDSFYQPELGETFKDLNGNGVWDAEYTTYTIYDDLLNEVIKQIGWPQKLINDLQVIYADININQLITTNKWLEQLGEYHAGTDNNQEGINNISTALIHPLGLIMSEFFLGEIQEADNSNAYGSLMFNSKFDQETIKALLLSLMGESNYFQLKAELEYFCEIFNVYMGPVLDEIAYYENFDLQSGNNASVQLYSYKAYLASVLLSASTAEWMHKTADTIMGNTEFMQLMTEWDYNSANFGGYKKFSALEPSEQKKLKELYDAHKERLAAQDINEDDSNYPDFMKAIEEYMAKDGTVEANAFEGRLEKVLSSFKSYVGREKAVVESYNEIKKAYNKIFDDSTISDDGIKKALKEVLIDPTAEYVAVDRSGDKYYTFGGYINDKDDDSDDIFFNQGASDDVVSFVNIKSSDELTRTQTVTSTKNLLDRVEQMRNIIKNNKTYSSVKDNSNLKDYFTKIIEYVYTKIDLLEDDNSSAYAGQRIKLEKQATGYLSIITDALKAEFRNSKKGLQDAGQLTESSANVLVKLLEIKSIVLSYNLMKNIANKDSVGDWVGQTDETKITTMAINESTLKDAFADLFDTGEWDNFWGSIGSLISADDNIKCVVYLSNESAVSYNNNNVDDVDDDGEIDKKVMTIKIPRDLPALIDYYNTAKALDRLDRYNIEFGIKTLYAENTDISFDVVVNNKKYTVGENFTKAKFLEYVCGANYLKEKNYDTVYVDDNYNGLISIDKNGNLVSSFNTLQKFLVELGDVSAVLAQMTNFVNLAPNSTDEIIIGNQTVDSTTINLSKYILKLILEGDYLANDLIASLFDVNVTNAKSNAIDKVDDYDPTTDDADRILNNVLSYLFLTDSNELKPNYVDYTKFTLKELRMIAFDALINYQEQEGESEAQNEKRYLAILALSCADWVDSSGNGAKNNSWNIDRKSSIDKLTTHKQSQATILRLAGLENRPYEELVGAEYTIEFHKPKPVDEANGDVFIMCTFDEARQVYVPFLMGNMEDYAFSLNSGFIEKTNGTTGETWRQAYGHGDVSTRYYMSQELYPVVAKGIITKDGLPTAIRQNGDNIEYYRDQVITHNVSEMGLSVYYVSVEQLQVHHTGFSYVTNMFSKMLTGKSLVEHLVSRVPKFAANSDYKFCYGVADNLVWTSDKGQVSARYNFDKDFCIPMDNLYDIREMNLFVLVIGVYLLFIAVFRGLWGVIQRTIDIAMLYLISPVVISTIAMREDSSDKDGNIIESEQDAYAKWYETIKIKFLSIFTLSVGFNIFFLVMPIISNVKLFANQVEYKNALSYASVFNRVDYQYINEIGRLILTVAAAYLITRATTLFSKVIFNNEEANLFTEGKATFTNVKNVSNSVSDVISGQYAIDKVEESLDTAKNLIPGVVMMAKAKDAARDLSINAAGKGASAYLQANGVPKEVADKIGKELVDAKYNKIKRKKERNNQRKEARQEREKKRT